MVDGSTVSAYNGSYTFSSVYSSHTIYVSFVSTLKFTMGTPTATGLTNGSIKAGYGVGVNVPVTTNGNIISATATIQGKTYNLESVNGTYQMPVNKLSVKGARVHYIPVNTVNGADLPMEIKLVAANKYDSSDTITHTANLSVKVVGNMYEDAHTGDR